MRIVKRLILVLCVLLFGCRTDRDQLGGIESDELGWHAIFPSAASRIETVRPLLSNHRTWFILQCQHMCSAPIYLFLPPDKQTPDIRRGKTIVVDGTNIETVVYAQVSPLLTPFDGTLRQPTPYERPFLLRGDIEDFTLIHLVEFIRNHTVTAKVAAERRLLERNRQEWEAIFSHTNAPVPMADLEAQTLMSCRLDWRLAPASVADGLTLRYPVVSVDVDENHDGRNPLVPQGHITITTAETCQNGETVVLIQTNMGFQVVETSIYQE